MTRLVGTLLVAFALAACSDDSPGFVAGGECAEGLLECAPGVEAECSAPLSDVGVTAPTPCDDTVTITDDAPADGYPVGETTVTFTATNGDATDSCATTVTVLDETPPEIECAPDVIAVRTSPEDPMIVAPAPLSATDACDAEVDVTASPAEVPYGTTEVEYTATDDAGLTATCTTQVTVLDGFAVEGLRVLSARLNAGDTTSVTIGWEPTGGDATGYRIDRAVDPDGPFSAVGTVAVDAAVFTDPSTADPHNYYRIVTLVGDLEGGATELIHAYAIAAADYDLDNQSVPGMSFQTTLYGVVRHPVDLAAGPYPLVVMLHGNHGNCRQNSTTDDYCQTRNGQDCSWSGFTTTPNAEGMLFQVETLAAQGYVAVTISGNAVNCRDDYIPERAQLMIEHLRRWKSWNDASAAPFGALFVGAVDMNRVGLVGHSRGGDAASSVPLALGASPVAGVTVASIFAIAPTDYHATTPVGTDYAVLLPACDGDVSNLWGMDIYDRGLDPDDHVVRSQVFFIGANHNFFSTEWYYDDGSTECSGSELVGGVAQRGMLEATEGAWFNGTLGGGPLDPFLRAEGSTPTSIDAWAGEDLDLRWSYAAQERTLVDEFEGTGTPDTNLLGGPNAFTGFSEDGQCYETGCGGAFIHHKGAAYLTWDYDATASATFDLGGLDASASAYLSFRVVSRTHAANNGLAEQNFGARLRDGDGDAAEIEVADVQTIPHLYGADDVRNVLQTVRIPLADLVAANPEFDLAALDSFELFFSVDGGRGAILVTDVEFAEADE